MKTRRRGIWVGSLAVVLVLLGGCVGMDLSPDGRRIVFTWQTHGDDVGLVQMNTDGTGFRAIPDADSGELPVWSPDGRRIVFRSLNRDETTGNSTGETTLKVYDAVRGTTRRLNLDVVPPFGWTNDSRSIIALHPTNDGDDEPREMVWFSLDANRVERRVAVPFDACDDYKLLTLPGSDEIALVGGSDANGARKRNAYRIDRDGGVHALTQSGDVIGLGRSGDGKRLLWAEWKTGVGVAITAFDRATGQATRLPFPAKIPEMAAYPHRAPNTVYVATFSPRGDRLLLQVVFGQKGKPRRAACYTVRTDGRDARLLWRGSLAAPRPDDNAADADDDDSPQDIAFLPSWSADGERIALLILEEKRATVALFNADGTGKSTLRTQTN